MAKISIEVVGLKLKNPLMNASGILGLTGHSLKRIADSGAGAVVSKSIGKDARLGNPNPTVVEVNCGLLNSMGLPNPGVDAALEEFEELLKTVNVPVIASIYGFSPEDFSVVAKKIDSLNFSAYELNVSCPHVKELGVEIGQNADAIFNVVRKVKSATSKPVLVKLSPNVSNIVEMARAAEDAGADGLTAINTLRAMKIDINFGRPTLSAKIGGLSGPAIKPVAVRCVYEISKSIKIPIIGCGGITSWKDAVEFFMAGASAVQIGTGILYSDLQIFEEIIKGLTAYMKKKKFKELKELIRLAHREDEKV